MKILVAVIVAFLLAASLFADYKWRSWMDARKREREDADRR